MLNRSKNSKVCGNEDKDHPNTSSHNDNANATNLHLAECATNTDDTLRFVPFEVDHWASKCVRFADEFQTCRSFEDAQSNILELRESLTEYLKLREGDGALRTDILLYCVLSNVMDGLKANDHIFTYEVPRVEDIIYQSLATSGQLGRYGFQSFKQSVKALKFLLEYYKRRDIEPRKLNVVLWQSVKKVSLKGTAMFPSLFPGEFHIHHEPCLDSEENCKKIRLDFGNTECPVFLKLCISANEIVNSLKAMSKQDLDFGCDHVQPVLEFVNAKTEAGEKTQGMSKPGDISFQSVVACDIDITRSLENQLISDIVQSLPRNSKSFSQLQRNVGGSVVVKFQSRHLNASLGRSCGQSRDELSKVYVLGTKQYYEKHCQTLLVDVTNPSQDEGQQNGWLVVDLNGRKVQEAKGVEIGEFKWDLKFGLCDSGCWTYPEVHFVNSLTVLPLIEDCHISFEDHECDLASDPSLFRPKCSDCILIDNRTSITVDQVFDTGNVQINVKLDLGLLNLLEGEVMNKAKFALFRFASSIPLEVRELVKELQKESKFQRRKKEGIFSDADFQQMLDFWDQHRDFYYVGWYNN